MKERIDMAVIGGGPAGLSAAVNAVARGKTVRILSAGGSMLDRAETVDNYLGFYKVTGEELMQRFEEHISALGLAVEKGRVSNLVSLGEYFLINFGQEILEAKAVILATGVSRVRALPGESELLGKGVSYCATCDGMLYRGKRAVVWGTAPDLLQETNFLQSIGVKATLVAAGERPPELHEEISFLPGKLTAVRGSDHVTAALAGGQEIPADAVFLLRHSIAPTALVDGLEMEDGYIRVNARMETNIPGLFAAGDCTGLPLQLSKATGDGLVAAQQAAKYIDAGFSPSV